MSKAKATQTQVQPEATPVQTNNALTVCRMPEGWALIRYEVQGDKVINQKILCGPDLRAVILEQFKIHAAKTFWN
jgi:hypothetical protein